MKQELTEEHELWLEELSNIYGEAFVINFLSQSIIHKEERLEDHLKGTENEITRVVF